MKKTAERKNRNVKYSIRSKMITLALLVAVPFLAMSIYLLTALNSYSEAYDRIVNNIAIANNYNLQFKENMDESLYKLVVGYTTFDKISEDTSLVDPYQQIRSMRNDFQGLLKKTTDKQSKNWLQSLIRNINTLEKQINEIQENVEADDKYDQNIDMLDNNIYIMTELIQENIQNYIYYQIVNMESLKMQLDKEVHSFIVLISIMMLLGICIATLGSILIVRSITKPLNALTQMTMQIAEGDFSARMKISSSDETAVLAKSFNEMNANIEALVQKIKEDERKMHYAELRLLQEQINPHFLYNTLDTIVWLVEGDETEKAVNMVMSLSEFFRLVLSKGREFITIKDEEQHIRSYLEIQKVRYGDIMDYNIDISPQLYDYRILKLTLQPLVENSLYHGIKYKRAKGTIYISGRLVENMVHLTVRDTGVGMNEEELEKLRSEICKPCKSTEKGFGLANVNERIRMNFGPQYGMRIESAEGVGTTIEIVIPAEKADKQDAQ